MADGWGRLQSGLASLTAAGHKYREEQDFKAGVEAVGASGEVDYANPALSTPGGLRASREALTLRSQQLDLKARESAQEADEIMRTVAKATSEAGFYDDPAQKFQIFKRHYGKINDGMDILDGQVGGDGKFTVTYANKNILDAQGRPKTTQVVYDDFNQFTLHAADYPTQMAKGRVQQAVQLDTYKRSLLFNDAAARRRAQLGLKPGDPLPDSDRQTLNKTFFGDPGFISDTVNTFNANLGVIDDVGKMMGWDAEKVKSVKEQLAIKVTGAKEPKVISPGHMVPNKDGGGHSVVMENPDGTVETKTVKGGEGVVTPSDSERMGEIKTPQGKRYSLSQLDTAYRRMYNIPSENDLFLKKALAASTKDQAAIKELEDIEKRRLSAPDFNTFIEEVRTKGAPWDRGQQPGGQAGGAAPGASVHPQPVQDALGEIRGATAPTGSGQDPAASSGGLPPDAAPAQPKVTADIYKKRWANAQASIQDPEKLTQYRANLEQHAMKNGVSPADF